MIYKLGTTLLLSLIFSISCIHAQIDGDSELYNLLKAKDSLLFEVGFNQCNIKQFEDLISIDMEFFHDKDGITNSKTSFITGIKENLCGSGNNSIKRVLDPTSLEVFPMYQNGALYGALQNGVHSFQQTKANFSHLWLLERGEWKLSRVFSYNHHLEQQDLKTNFIKLSVDELGAYEGVYVFSPEFSLTVQIRDGVLYGGSQGQDVVINCYEEHRFIDNDQVHDLQFILNDEGNVTGLYMKGSGMEMTAQKMN